MDDGIDVMPNSIRSFPTILQVNTADSGGGAEKIAWELHQRYLARNLNSWLAVDRKYSEDTSVLPIPHKMYQAFWVKLAQKIAKSDVSIPERFRRFCNHLGKIHHRISKKRGYENFYFPGTWHLLDLPPQHVDILHAHNLHGGFFDLRALPMLSSRVPFVITLHDMWMFCGYCAYSFACERWKNGCEHCPYLHTFPVRRDATAYNWKRKQNIFAKSKLYVATPSYWLMQLVEQSMLAPAVIESRVIYNGMDLSVFFPTDKTSVRTELGIPANASVILATAVKIIQNSRKDYRTMRETVELLGRMIKNHPIYFIALGGDQPPEQIGQITMQFVPFQSEEAAVAQYYQAADVYIHAARADNLPNTVSEALACGTPVVATAIGGIPEQIDDGETGFLVPPESPEDMARAIQKLLQNNTLHRQMSIRAAETARQRFDANRMVEEYLGWYQEILSS